MSEKIENNDVIQEVKDQEVIDTEARDVESSEKPSEPETKEITKEEIKVPFRKRKAVKVVTAIGAGAAATLAIGIKLVSSFGKKRWNEGYEEGWHDGQETWSESSDCEPEETIEAQEEYPEEDE